MAKISPPISNGINIPVEAFASNAKTKSMTMKTAIPLTPDLAIPSKNAPSAARRKSIERKD